MTAGSIWRAPADLAPGDYYVYEHGIYQVTDVRSNAVGTWLSFVDEYGDYGRAWFASTEKVCMATPAVRKKAAIAKRAADIALNT